MKKSRFSLPIALLILLSFVLGTSEFIIIGILPNIAEGIDCSLVMAGNLISLFALFYAIGTPFITAFVGRYNRYYTLTILLGIFIVGNILCGFAPNYTTLLISRIVIAIVSGTLVAIAMTFPNDLVEAKDRPTVISWIFSGFSIATVFGVPIGTIITQVFDWRTTFFVLSAFSVILLISLWKYLPNVGSGKKSNLVEQFALFKSSRINLGMLIIICGAAGTYAVYTYITPILQNSLHIANANISIILGLFGACTIVSNLGSGKVATMGGIRKLPIIYMLQIITLAIIPFTVNYLVLGIANILFIGVIIYLHNASVQIHFLKTASLEKPEAITLASSLNPISFNIGIALGSACGSGIISVVDMPYVGFGGAIFVIIALLFNLKLLNIMSDLKHRPVLHFKLKHQ